MEWQNWLHLFPPIFHAYFWRSWCCKYWMALVFSYKNFGGLWTLNLPIFFVFYSDSISKSLTNLLCLKFTFLAWKSSPWKSFEEHILLQDFFFNKYTSRNAKTARMKCTINTRYLSRFFSLLSTSKPKCNFGHWSKMTLSCLGISF